MQKYGRCLVGFAWISKLGVSCHSLLAIQALWNFTTYGVEILPVN